MKKTGHSLHAGRRTVIGKIVAAITALVVAPGAHTVTRISGEDGGPARRARVARDPLAVPRTTQDSTPHA